jgi:hypothetical protein
MKIHEASSSTKLAAAALNPEFLKTDNRLRGLETNIGFSAGDVLSY